MSADFDSGVFTGGVPAWHGLGVVLPNDALDSREALQYSGLAGWELTKQPVYAGNPEDGYRQIVGHAAVTRGMDHKVLGVVGDRYSIVANETAFDWMDSLLGGEGFHYKTAGSLSGGSVVWLLAKAPFAIDLPDSKVDMYVLLTNSHDGSGAVKAAITPVRVVCSNTLRAALGSAKATVSIRHTVNAATKLAEAQRVLGLTKGAAERLASEADRLANTRLTDADFAAFLDKLVPVPSDEGRGRTMAKSAQTSISRIYSEAPDQLPIYGTSWGALNAVVAHHDHAMTSRQSQAGSPAENRMARILLRDGGLPDKAAALLS